ncbi:AAA family ATPase [Rhizobium sp. CFBP 8762]|uniref:AAA family ATPase n=1 Tax=Rhizobium sp. CFBP 8762 TaxID=2775279 RepID=UPI00177D19E4|nr:AAA family ATPase [Rhizobium sp. CFBP 8762]MBD8554237.1 AAA family ATPase [Rhizobium sp. CFBP 8762]
MKAKPNVRLPPPYLKSLSVKPDWTEFDTYPYCLPLMANGDFSMQFTRPVTIIVGENGIGKSTLLEGIAALVGFDDAGGANGYRPVDHANAVEVSGGILSKALRAAWLPKTGLGWFFKAETFFSVARYLDAAAREGGSPAPDFLSHSHGEGFLRFFQERCRRRGVFIMDEPESALSPRRQIEFLKIVHEAETFGGAQIIMATHSTIIMAYPSATLLRLDQQGLSETTLEDTGHFDVMRAFCADPHGFIENALTPVDQ